MSVRRDILCQLSGQIPLIYRRLPEPPQSTLCNLPSPGTYVAKRTSMTDTPVKHQGSTEDKDSQVVVPCSTLRDQHQVKTSIPRNFDAEIEHLQSENLRLRDKIQRLLLTLDDEIHYWEEGLRDNKWETYDALKRRLSRLKGARDYLGNSDYVPLCQRCHDMADKAIDTIAKVTPLLRGRRKNERH